ncbi:MAG: efflux RND transporter permease subunit, partial [Stenotrophobium sp.]
MSDLDTSEAKLGVAHKILRTLEPLIYAKRWLTMGILVVITVFLFAEMLLIKTDAGFDKSIPLEHPYMKVLKQYMADFGGANTVLVALIQKNGNIYNEKFLTELKQATDEVFFLPGVDRSRVSSLFTPDVRYIEVVEGGFKGGNVIPSDYSPTPEMFQTIRDHVSKAEIIGRLTTKDQRGAMIFSELLETDPVTGARLDYGKVANMLEDRVRGRFTHKDKYLYTLKSDYTSPDGKYKFKAGQQIADGFTNYGWKLRFHSFDATQQDPITNQTVIIPIEGDLVNVKEVVNPQYNPDVDVHIIGFAKVVGDVIDATLQVVVFFLVTLIMTMILLWLYVGSFKLAVLPLICSIVAVIWEFGLLRLLGYGLDPFAILVPFLILAVSVSHGVQYVNAWVGEVAENGRNSFDASLFTWRRLAIYGTMAIMTDVVGFGTIYLIPIDIIREMSINASLGMAAIIITNKIMMPIMLTWVDVGDPKAFAEKQTRRDAVFDPVWRLLSGMVKPAPAIITLLICSILLGWSLWKGQELQVGDSQSGVPELLPDSRFNKDFRAVTANFAIGVDIFKVIAEMDPESCVKYTNMEQVDRFAWHMTNTPGVASTLSLPQMGKVVNSAFSEASPKFFILPRNKYAIVQAITPIPPSSGLLNPDCSALAVFVFTKDHTAATIERIVDKVNAFNKSNGEEYYKSHTDVDPKYCADKTAALRHVGSTDSRLEKVSENLRKKHPGISDDKLAANSEVKSLTKQHDDAETKLKSFDRACPVNFAMASGNVGVMAATNQEVHRLEKLTLLYVYIAIVVCVYLSFFEWESILCIMLPL